MGGRECGRPVRRTKTCSRESTWRKRPYVSCPALLGQEGRHETLSCSKEQVPPTTTWRPGKAGPPFHQTRAHKQAYRRCDERFLHRPILCELGTCPRRHLNRLLQQTPWQRQNKERCSLFQLWRHGPHERPMQGT